MGLFIPTVAIILLQSVVGQAAKESNTIVFATFGDWVRIAQVTASAKNYKYVRAKEPNLVEGRQVKNICNITEYLASPIPYRKRLGAVTRCARLPPEHLQRYDGLRPVLYRQL